MTELMEIFSQGGSEEMVFSDMMMTIICSLVSGLMVAFTYYFTNKDDNANKNFLITLIMLPVIMSVIILFVGSNVARAFSLAGTVSIIRFRSTAGDPKEIGYIFFAVAAGLCAGIGYLLYGIVFVAILCLIMILIEKGGCMNFKSYARVLKITVPEDLNYHDTFEGVLLKYTKNHSLYGVKTADLGSVYVLTYHIQIKKGINEKEMIDELRCRNANLEIVYSEVPRVEK